jgi:metacaspase-1
MFLYIITRFHSIPFYSMSSSLSASRPPRRTALLVGINYRGTDNELNGCYNDVVNVSQYLRTVLGYSASSVSVLTDGNRGPAGAGTASALPPTRQNILAGMAALVAGMVAGDEAVFHFSGHGTLVRDRNGDEASGLDSCLCPLDYNAPASAGGGVVIDDEIRALLVNKVPRGARLYLILDCCHNGTGCDVRYKYEDFSILLRPPSARTAPLWRTQQKAFADGKYAETAGEVFMISGCRDEQTSADAYINNAFAGALTYAVFAILRANNATIRTYSWSALLRDVRHFMRVNRYSQIPQLMTGQLITPARPVFVVAAGARGGTRSASSVLELSSGSGGVGGAGARGVSASDAPATLFSFSVKPKSGSKSTTRHCIQFLV